MVFRKLQAGTYRAHDLPKGVIVLLRNILVWNAEIDLQSLQLLHFIICSTTVLSWPKQYTAVHYPGLMSWWSEHEVWNLLKTEDGDSLFSRIGDKHTQRCDTLLRQHLPIAMHRIRSKTVCPPWVLRLYAEIGLWVDVFSLLYCFTCFATKH